jgi:hypothetical protein
MEFLRQVFRRRRSREIGWKVHHHHQLLMLSGAGFELAVADLLHDMGFRKVVVCGGAGDLAADIVGKDEHGRSFVAQCKRYDPSHTVGSREIQLFIGMATTHHRAERPIFATTSRFTAPARKLADSHGIELLDGDRLASLLVQVRGEPPAESDLPVNVLVNMGVEPSVLDIYAAVQVREQNLRLRRDEARRIGCQCVRGDAEWSVSGDLFHMYGELVAWCPACGRAATEKEVAKMRREMASAPEPPPDWKPPAGWTKPTRPI